MNNPDKFHLIFRSGRIIMEVQDYQKPEKRGKNSAKMAY